MRADLFLYTRGFAKSRTAAAEMIKSGVSVNGKEIKKPSEEIPDNLTEYSVSVSDPLKYVSRGGLKLEAALDAFGISPKWLTCADFGASTGGFTDCLLQRGADRVFAIDVGHGQLDESLQRDRRVTSIEGMNVRNVTKDDIGTLCDLVVSDLSFISQTLVYDNVCGVLRDGGYFISLIKPQFEAGPGNIGKNGIVKDRKVHIRVIENIISKALEKGLNIKGLIPSPVKGGDGNTEYLVIFEKGGTPEFPNVEMTVNEAMKK